MPLANKWARPVKPDLLTCIVRHRFDTCIEVTLLRFYVLMQVLSCESVRCMQIVTMLFHKGNSDGGIVIRRSSDEAAWEHSLPAKHGHVWCNAGGLFLVARYAERTVGIFEGQDVGSLSHVDVQDGVIRMLGKTINTRMKVSDSRLTKSYQNAHYFKESQLKITTLVGVNL